MITSFDPEYKRAKLIKQGAIHLAAPYDQLGQWIARRWQVDVLDVAHEIVPTVNRPRLAVVVERESALRHLQDPFRGTFPSVEAEIIAQLALHIQTHPTSTSVDNIFVVFSAFAPLAQEEANQGIQENEIAGLFAKLGNPALWQIRRGFRSATFFFFTDKQMETAEKGGLKQSYAEEYFRILKKYDEFDYLRLEEFKIGFDSKENFDTNFSSNWFHYDRQ